MNYQVVEIADNFFLIRSPEKDFHRNSYVRIFEGNGKRINMVLDPGGREDFPYLQKVYKDLIGGVQNINLIFLSHQDPDLSGNINTIFNLSPAKIITSYDTWRLIKSYGLPEKRLIPAEKYTLKKVKFATGHVISFLPSRFCHFLGAMMFYDYEDKVLFTGDFFGGLDTKKSEGIFSNDESWEGIELFHKLYMPSEIAIQRAIDGIRNFLPNLPETIAPQHGDLISGSFIDKFMSKMYQLKVGINALEESVHNKEQWLMAFNLFLNNLKSELSESDYTKVLNKIILAENFTPVYIFDKEGKVVDTKVLPDIAFQVGYKIAFNNVPQEIKDKLHLLAVISLTDVGLDIPEYLMLQDNDAFNVDIF